MEKKVYEAPEVTKVEIDFSDRIIAAGCGDLDSWGMELPMNS